LENGNGHARQVKQEAIRQRPVRYADPERNARAKI